MSQRRWLSAALLTAVFVVSGCGNGGDTPPNEPVSPTADDAAAAPSTESGAEGSSDGEPTQLVLASYSSFSASDDVLAHFEAENNVKLRVLDLGGTGEALNKIILSKDAPLADVFFGVDNNFLSRALAADVFEPYASPVLEIIDDDLRLDPDNRLLPVDYGYVNINADRQWFTDEGVPYPQTLEDLTDPVYKGLLVVQNPATSSPGLAFLLATISHFGEEGYLDFWRDLRANDVLVTDGWSEAYFEHFTVGSAGQGDRPLVVSYTTSPPADVLYAEDGREEPGSFNISPPGGTFRQVEFVGVLKGTEHPELARRLVDYLLDTTFQNDLPLQMFVYPANSEAQVPDLFTQFAEEPEAPAKVAPDDIESNREAWIAAWTDVMLR